MSATIAIRHMTIRYGEDQGIDVTADLVDDLGGGLSRVIGTYKLSLAGTFQDGSDVDGIEDAFIYKLRSAGVIA